MQTNRFEDEELAVVFGEEKETRVERQVEVLGMFPNEGWMKLLLWYT